ncbi:MAG: TPM domain-containing protein [Isosphaeraceae bacterium]
MIRLRWFSVLSLATLAVLAVVPAQASGVRDRAGMFSPDVVKKVDAQLDQIERRSNVSVVIETIDSLPGLARDATSKTKNQRVEQVAEERALEIGYEGVYLLISKNDRVLSNVLVRERLDSRLPREKRLAIRDTLRDEFKAGRYDQGLTRAAQFLDSAFSGPVRAVAPHRAAAPQPLHGGEARAPKFGLGSLLAIGLGIFGVLVVIRVLGGLFNRSAGGYPGPMQAGGMPGAGMGPGYGGPGYGYGGPRGGGFFSGMLGGLGGALAGNWLYDQFSGRHGSHGEASGYTPPGAESPAGYDAGGGFVGGDDDRGGASWDSGNDGGNWGDTGGDWGGGDGGGDWGGGGGDWGGGGGDGGW